MSGANIYRRTFLALLLGVAGVLNAAGPSEAQSGKFTEWGWPQPYEKVSDKSVAWLKEKGWWPLQVAFQSPWSGQNNINIVMDKEGLLAKRGIEMKLTAFGSGPAVNEVLVSGKVQVASAGNFPYTSLLDKQIPVKVIALITPNILHATIVPLDSKINSLTDLKGANPPATIGIVTGSSAEFYFQMAAQVAGLKIGKDVILKNMPIGEQMALPKGIDAVVPWDAGASMIVQDRKNGRIVDSIYPYNMYEGNFVVRQELIDNVPDVVQALSDAYVESLLWTRHDLDGTVKHLQADPSLKNFTQGDPGPADPHLQRPLQADLRLPAREVLGRSERADLQLALRAEAYPAAAEGRRLCQFGRRALHGQDLRQARLEGARDAAIHPGRLEGLARQVALSGVRHAAQSEGAAALPGKGRPDQAMVVRGKDLQSLIALKWHAASPGGMLA